MPDYKKYLVAPDNIKLSLAILERGHKEVVVIAPGFNQMKDSNIFKRLALDFAKDFDCISFDLRGHGLSGGIFTFGSKETEDLKVILDYAHSHYDKVHLIGFSMGAFIAINETARFNNVSSLTLVSGPMSFKKIEARFLEPTAVKIGINSIKEGDANFTIGVPFMKKENPIDNISKINIPILFLHGDKDPIVGIRHAKALYKKANLPKKLVIFEEGSHAEELYRQFSEDFMRITKEFFKEGAGDGKHKGEGGGSSRLHETVGYIK